MAKREKASKQLSIQSLSVEDTDFLKKNTKYSEDDLKSWFKSEILLTLKLFETDLFLETFRGTALMAF